MHVGVYLPGLKAETGGGFTFVQDLAGALLRSADKSRHSFTLFCEPDVAARISSAGLPANVRACGVKTRKAVARLRMAARHFFPGLVPIWRGRGAFEKAAAGEGVELVWYLGGNHDTLDIPYIATVWDVQHRTHPWFPEVSAKGVWEYREAFLLRHLKRASYIITGTQAGREELSHFYGIAPDRIRILPHPTPAFALDASGGGEAGAAAVPRPFLLYPAQFWPHKNHVNLLHAMRRLHDTRDDAPDLVLVGSDKGNRDYIKDVAVELGLAEKVHFRGFVPIEELIALYRNAIALVYASFSGPENLPPLEAFALGCPVVASQFEGSREQLGEAAIFFPPESPADMAAAIAQVLDDQKLREDLIARGHARARRWTADDYVEGVFSIIDDFEPFRINWR